MPKALAPFLRAWWQRAGEPESDPVFPVTRGERAGQVRFPVGLYPLYFETATTRPVDFHSLRRSFNTALAEAGVNVQHAMHLAAHSDPKVHARYVMHAPPKGAGLVSREDFSVDGTLIEALASLKSFKRKDASEKDDPPTDDPGNPSVDFHSEKRSNETHESKLSYSAHALIENRNGLLVAIQMDEADGHAERRNALEMLDESLPGNWPVTVGGDKGYDTRDFVEACRERRRSAIDERTTRHRGYAISQRFRKRIEEVFGWMKTVGNLRKTRFRGFDVNQIAAYMVGAAYNLLRVAKLLAAPA